MKPAVSGLEEEFPGRVECHNVDATTTESRTEIEKLGFKNHGLVIRDAEGEALWKQPDHEVKIESIREALQELLAKEP